MDEKCCCFEYEGDNPDCPLDHKETHRAKHVELHKSLDELLADYIANNKGKLPSNTTVLELLRWSYQQTKKEGEQS